MIENAQTTPASQWFDVFGPRVRFLAGNDRAIGDNSVILSRMPSKIVVPLHSHADREVMFVLAGSLDVYHADRWQTLTVGDLIDIKGHEPHALRNSSSDDVHILILTTPRMEQFFREIGREPSEDLGPPEPKDMANLLEAAGRYGYWMASPDDNFTIGIFL